MSSKYDLTVIAPCYNEENNINALATRLLKVFSKHHIRGQIVLVNDCSTDRTGEYIDELAAKHPEVKPIHHQTNK